MCECVCVCVNVWCVCVQMCVHVSECACVCFKLCVHVSECVCVRVKVSAWVWLDAGTRVGVTVCASLHYRVQVVSWDNGNQLYAVARAERADATSVTFVTFDGVGHDDICYDDRLDAVLRAFWGSIHA